MAVEDNLLFCGVTLFTVAVCVPDGGHVLLIGFAILGMIYTVHLLLQFLARLALLAQQNMQAGIDFVSHMSHQMADWILDVMQTTWNAVVATVTYPFVAFYQSVMKLLGVETKVTGEENVSQDAILREQMTPSDLSKNSMFQPVAIPVLPSAPANPVNVTAVEVNDDEYLDEAHYDRYDREVDCALA